MVKSKKKEPTRSQKTPKSRKGKSGVKKLQVKKTDKFIINTIKKVNNEYVFSYKEDTNDESIITVNAPTLDEIRIKWNEVVAKHNEYLKNLQSNKVTVIDKITDQEVIFRLTWKEEVVELLVDGFPHNQILSILSSKYNLSLETIYNCIYEVLNDLKKISQDELKQLIIVHQERYNFLYRRFLDVHHDKLAIKTLESIEKLYGHHSESILIQINNFTNQQRNIFDISKISDSDMKFLKSVIPKIKYIGEEKE